MKNMTPTFIYELKLKTTPAEEKILNTRLDIGRQIYNACLGELLKRLKLMRDSKLYRKALKEPQQVTNSQGNLTPYLYR